MVFWGRREVLSGPYLSAFVMAGDVVVTASHRNHRPHIIVGNHISETMRHIANDRTSGSFSWPPTPG